MVNKIIAIFLRLLEKHQIIGGEDIRRYEILKAIKGQGLQIEIYTTEMKPTGMSNPLILDKQFNLKKFLWAAKIFLPFIIFKCIVSAKRRGYNVLMTQYPFAWDTLNNIMGICSLFLSLKILRMKIWAEVHDIPTIRLKFYPKKLIYLILEKTLLTASSYITFSSQCFLEYVRKAYNVSAKLSVLYVGIDPNDYWTIPGSRIRLRKGFEPYKVMYIGSFWDADLEMAINSIQRLREKGLNIELSLISYNPPNKKPMSWVKFSQAKYVDFIKITNNFDILIIPNNLDPYLQLAFSLKVPMYLASGKPVVIGRTKELENFFGKDTDLFLFSNPDVSSLSEKIESLVLNQDLSKKISEKAFKYVTHQMTWNHNVRKSLKEIELI